MPWHHHHPRLKHLHILDPLENLSHEVAIVQLSDERGKGAAVNHLTFARDLLQRIVILGAEDEEAVDSPFLVILRLEARRDQ